MAVARHRKVRVAPQRGGLSKGWEVFVDFIGQPRRGGVARALASIARQEAQQGGFALLRLGDCFGEQRFELRE